MYSPPAGCRYISLHFTPRAIQACTATLLAEVEGGSDPRTRAFTCELRGEGSLPSLTLQVTNRIRGLWVGLAVCSQFITNQ